MRSLLRWGGVGCLSLLSASVGAFVTRRVGLTNESIPYADFITIMLTAVSVLITALAIFLAVLGVIGWNSVQAVMTERARKYLDEGFEPGNRLEAFVSRKIENIVEAKVTEAMFRGVNPGTDEGGEE